MRTDILLGDDNDLIFSEDGDLENGLSDEQHILHILMSSPGYYKQYPLIGANTTQMLNGPLTTTEQRRIKIAIEADGYKVNKVEFSNDGGIDIDAE